MHLSCAKRAILFTFCFSLGIHATPIIFIGPFSLPYTISAPGTYVLSDNITFSPGSSQTAITINSSNVLLDLNQKTITAGNTNAVTGVDIPLTATNITISNGTLRWFVNEGVKASTAGYSELNFINLDIIGTGGGTANGFELTTVRNSSIQSCSSTYNLNGAVMTNCSNLSIVNSRFNNNIGTTATTSGIETGGTCSNFVIADSEFNNNSNSNSTVAGLRQASTCRCWHIRNCSFNGNFTTAAAVDTYGADISCEGALIENCSFCRNANANGGASTGLVTGLRLGSASRGSLVRNCTFNRNVTDSTATTTVLGARIAAIDTVIENSAAIGNASTSGSSSANVVAFENSTNTAYRCVAVGNRVTGTGTVRAFDVGAGATTYIECKALNNAAEGAGSFSIGFYNTRAQILFRACEAQAMSAGTSGGAIGFFSSNGTCTFEECNANQQQGGTNPRGFEVTSSAQVFDRCTANNNVGIGFFDTQSAGTNKYYGCKGARNGSYNFSDVIITLTITMAGGSNLSGATTSYKDAAGGVYGFNEIANYSFA